MTVGSPSKKIITFMIPMLLGNIAQQLYNTVDSIIVGRYVGDNALSAVGGAGPILNLLLVLFVGIAIGAGIMVSQYFGAKQREELSRAIGCCITLTGIATLAIMVIAPLITKPLLRLIQTPDSIMDGCYWYLTILFIGVAGSSFYNILCGILRGLGDSMSALLYLLIATGINIVLDLLFVAVFGWGVVGVAIATVIAQFISALLALRRLLHMKHVFDMDRKYLRPQESYVNTLIRLGLPSGLTQAIMSVSMLIVQSLTNSFGEQLIAANVIVMRVDGFAMLPAFSFGTAMTTFAGQNIGAGQIDRVKKGAVQGTLIAVFFSAVLTGLIVLFGRGLMGVFTETQELITISYNFMCILALGYVAMEVTQCLSGIMRGAGDTVTPMAISIVVTLILRMPLAYLLVHLTKSEQFPNGNFYSLPVSLLTAWILGACINTFFYRFGTWKKKG
ncbi:MAG: MATE family efflux transporter, partial [Clostridium sp.]|nr:MATE family efflux transporter [Clostridium sp.]